MYLVLAYNLWWSRNTLYALKYYFQKNKIIYKSLIKIGGDLQKYRKMINKISLGLTLMYIDMIKNYMQIILDSIWKFTISSHEDHHLFDLEDFFFGLTFSSSSSTSSSSSSYYSLSLVV